MPGRQAPLRVEPRHGCVCSRNCQSCRNAGRCNGHKGGGDPFHAWRFQRGADCTWKCGPALRVRPVVRVLKFTFKFQFFLRCAHRLASRSDGTGTIFERNDVMDALAARTDMSSVGVWACVCFSSSGSASTGSRRGLVDYIAKAFEVTTVASAASWIVSEGPRDSARTGASAAGK